MTYILGLSCALLLLGGVFSQALSQQIHAGYRKDFFYPYDEYREVNLPDPIDGGRFHLVTTAMGSGSPQQVMLNGQVVSFATGQDPDDWFVDWLHVYPTTLSQGEPVWISFHSRNKVFDKSTSATIEIRNSSSAKLVSGSFPVTINFCNITYVTTTPNYTTLLIHVHNGYTDTKTVQKVLVNNTDVTSSVANRQSLSIPPFSSNLISIPLKAPVVPGSLYTVVLQYADQGAAESVAGGRVAKTHFPIEAWPKSHECPFPTVEDDNYKWHRDHGIDTLFFGNGAAQPCGGSVPGTTIAGELAPKYGFYCLINNDIPLKDVKNSSNVLAVLLSDELDTHLDDGLRTVMNATNALWAASPSVLTYSGGSRSRRDGIFAGVTDIQGMDMYIAACAPHVQEFLHPPPPRGSYDYLRLTRKNHMPLPTWTYSQLLDDGWDFKVGSVVVTHRQPNPAEARVQAMSVIAAGAKGLMYFQSEIAENKYYPDTWVEIGNFNKDIGAVRQYLQQGDCTDMVTNSDGDDFDAESVSQAIRSPEAILVTVINLKNDGGYTDEACAIGINEHWKFNPHTVEQMLVTVPPDFGSVVDMFEVQNGVILNITSMAKMSHLSLGKDYYGNSITAQQISLNNMHFPTSLMTRLFILANTPEVRETVENNLKKDTV